MEMVRPIRRKVVSPDQGQTDEDPRAEENVPHQCFFTTTGHDARWSDPSGAREQVLTTPLQTGKPGENAVPVLLGKLPPCRRSPPAPIGAAGPTRCGPVDLPSLPNPPSRRLPGRRLPACGPSPNAFSVPDQGSDEDPRAEGNVPHQCFSTTTSHDARWSDPSGAREQVLTTPPCKQGNRERKTLSRYSLGKPPPLSPISTRARRLSLSHEARTRGIFPSLLEPAVPEASRPAHFPLVVRPQMPFQSRTRGRSMTILVPKGRFASARTSPPWSDTIWRTMARPRPVPPFRIEK